ncbi:MAG: HAD family hydrolase [Spirochaetes bacterium DG_61]|jgi:putative hydrolase of HD superfamily|nr:MAG: HAD family hydrolase [Spirochaetes bacterium DG_61]
MMKKGLLEKIYEAASIQRWNDHARPIELTELDKQAHKMLIVYIIAKQEEIHGRSDIHWLYLIEGGIFEFLHRVVLTDIKPTVFHKMMAKKGRELNEYVFQRLEPDIRDIRGDFSVRFRNYFFDPDYAFYEKRILSAAHYLATHWEFTLIYNLNRQIHGIERTREEIEGQLEDYYDFIGIRKISLGKKSFGFLDLCGQLRFQKRWSGTPRVPLTSVLGHMLIVAMLTLFSSFEIDACPKRLYNNFYAGLFHDLPEVLTRDIISPVKRSVSGLEEIIKEYEKKQVEEVLLPLLPEAAQREIRYFIEDEFENKIVKSGEVVKGIPDDRMGMYNDDAYSPLDGSIIKACDELAAFIEARLSIQYGIGPPTLQQAAREIYATFKNKHISGVDIGALFDYFK